MQAELFKIQNKKLFKTQQALSKHSASTLQVLSKYSASTQQDSSRLSKTVQESSQSPRPKKPRPLVFLKSTPIVTKGFYSKTRQDSSRLVRTRQDSSRLVKTRQDSSRLVKTRQDSSRLVKTRQDSARLFKSPLKVLALKILGLCIGIFKKYSHSHKGLFFKKVYFSFPFKSFLVLLLQGKRRLGRRSSPLLVLHNGRFLSAR
jgi:hypothetical protein